MDETYERKEDNEKESTPNYDVEIVPASLDSTETLNSRHWKSFSRRIKHHPLDLGNQKDDNKIELIFLYLYYFGNPVLDPETTLLPTSKRLTSRWVRPRPTAR